MTKTINTVIKLDETLHTRLKALGTAKERTPHWLMKAAIEEYVEREETYEIYPAIVLSKKEESHQIIGLRV